MSLAFSSHLMILPVVLPLLVGAYLITINEARHDFKFTLNLISVLLQAVIAVSLLVMVDSEYWQNGIGVYLAANWAAPFGIVLMVDRLTALMLVLTSVLAVCVLLYSMSRWSRIGVHFHSLFQFMLMGLNGAFLTHDLFNLFVFFEVMLAASYGLLLHGYNLPRIRAGMQFIAINLLASLMFLIGVSLIYAATGSLNMADVAVRAGQAASVDAGLLSVGVGVLAIAFLTKCAAWPLGFWLPTTYAAASPPVAAMFVLMTKVGIYVILRMWQLAFGGEQAFMSGFGSSVLFWTGVATIVFGAFGMLASDRHGRLAGYAAVISSGTLLALIGLDSPNLLAIALYYLVASTLGMAAFMLLAELVERNHNPVEALLSVTREAFDIEETPEQPVGVSIPATFALLGMSFAICVLLITGLPPLSGFLAKLGLLSLLLTGENGQAGILLGTLILVAGMCSIIALLRFGVRTFWAAGAGKARLQVTEVLPVQVLLLCCIALTVFASPAFEYTERAAGSLSDSALYARQVLAEPVIPGPVTPGSVTAGDNP